MDSDDLFSKRSGFAPDPPPVSIREDAPAFLRDALGGLLHQAGVSPKTARTVLCECLRVVADSSNWSDPNVSAEVDSLLFGCPWYRVYDFIEAIYPSIPERTIASSRSSGNTIINTREVFTAKINSILIDLGVAWQLVDGRIVARGEEIFERSIVAAADALDGAGRATAASELRKALADLSRRPDADVTGAIQHAMAAFECFARDKAGAKGTLGDVMKQHAGTLGIPKPLDAAIEKMWGFSSERARHLQEGGAPSVADAELVVAFVAAMVNYLS